jgi:hypothetical protein
LLLLPQAKLAKLRREILEPKTGGGGGAGDGEGQTQLHQQLRRLAWQQDSSSLLHAHALLSIRHAHSALQLVTTYSCLMLLPAGFDVNKVGDARVGFVGGWHL